ncbi:MAG: SPASM domain-containing protein [Candidatus Omnitrophica bacterium]|nr:SPASM domain-containing protein [Candidatus Omnitrophota bacterium]
MPKKIKIPPAKYPLLLIYNLIGAMFSQDHRIAGRLMQYFGTYRSFAGELLNQLSRYARSPKSFLPQGILIEPTNLCNLKCGHCSTQRNNEPRGLMDLEFYKSIIDANPQITCIILSRYGEPFLHPKILDMIAYAKKRNIYVSTYTNGILLSREKADGVISNGLDEIIFSLEGIGDRYEKNRGTPYGALKENMEYLIERRDRSLSGIRIGINVARIADGDDYIEMVKKEWQGKVDNIDVEPLIGNKYKARETACRTLWRNAVIRWDGIVFPCCVDMDSTLPIGDLKKNSLKEIFNGDKAVSLRKSHIEKRYPPVCRYCDAFFG